MLDSFTAWCLLRLSLHGALTILFILSEYWMSHATPQKSRGLMLGILRNFLSLGIALGPLIFSWTGSTGYLPFAIACMVVVLATLPLAAAFRKSPDFKEGACSISSLCLESPDCYLPQSSYSRC